MHLRTWRTYIVLPLAGLGGDIYRGGRPPTVCSFYSENYFNLLTESIRQYATVGVLSRSGLWDQNGTAQKFHTYLVQFYPAAGLTNNVDSSKKLKVMWLIIPGRTTHVHRFNYSHQFWHRKPLARAKVRIESDARSTICVQDRMTPTFCSRSVTEPLQDPGGYVFTSVSLFVC